jgi:signal transduction histidine kinase
LLIPRNISSPRVLSAALLKFFCIFFLILLVRVSPAQNSVIDSLKGLLNAAGTDSLKADILLQLSRAAGDSTTLTYASQSLQLSKKLNSKRLMAQGYFLRGRYLYFKEKFAASLENCIIAFRLAKDVNEYRLAGSSCLYIGYNHYNNEPKIALEYYLKSVYYSKISGNLLLESYAYSAIGNLYEKWEDGKNALGYYLQSLKIREQAGSAYEVISSLIETARAYHRIAQYGRSNELIEKALALAEKNGQDDQNLIYLYQMKGYHLSDRLNKYPEALQYFLKSYDMVRRNNAFDQNNISSLKPVAETYYKLGDHVNASRYFKMYFELMEIEKRKMDKKLFESQFILQKETEKQKFLLKDAEILKQKVQLERERIFKVLFISGLLLLLIFTFFVYRNYRAKRRSNIVLDQKVKERTLQLAEANTLLTTEISERKITQEKLRLSETKLTEINRELESFIYRASHDLKGPLSSSMGLIGLAMNAKTETEIQQYIGMIAVSLGKLDGILVDLQELAFIRQGKVVIRKTDIVETINNLITNFRGYENYEKIKFSVNNQMTNEFYTDQILIQAILRNVLENAVKYSQRGINDPYVEISVKQQGAYNLIQVKDNGMGISPEFHSRIFDVFFRANDVTKGSGMGLYIVKNAVNKLNGKVEIERSEPQMGTTMNLYFPS